MNKKTKKICIKIILGIYLVANFFQSMLYTGNNVYAASSNSSESVNYKNIVAIIVNNDIYDSLKDDINRYAKEYIQGENSEDNTYNSISNSQSLVFPINTDNFSAKNITQLLENIYFGGIDGQTSKLIGVVLIGDIPLPVVNQNGYIYPTIYPYVDFEEQKFMWDDGSQYFIYNNNPYGQAEIWHGIINFDTTNEYKDYFKKLKRYWNDSESFVDKAIWYEDFIGNTKYFNDTSLNAYLNNFIFAEDLGYHRYSDLMIKVLQGQRNNEVKDVIDDMVDAFIDIGSTGADAMTTGLEVLMNSSNLDMNTPTMQIKAVIDNGYISSYSDLFGQKFLGKITDNVETSNRWIETLTGPASGEKYYVNALDTVYEKAEFTDEILLRKESGIEPFIIMLNNALEEAVDIQVENEKYWLNEVIPLTYLNYKGITRGLLNNKCVWEIYDAYENYYFGTNARYLESMEDTSTYRGTYRNFDQIDGLTIQKVQSGYTKQGIVTGIVPSTDLNIDLNKKSIGGSYEIFSQQVDANRGYNYDNSLTEYQIYSGNKTAKKENRGINCVNRFLGMCIKNRWAISDHNGSGCDLSEDGDQGGCETPTEYGVRIWGGASPLNLDAGVGGNFIWKSGYTYTGAIGEIFDIGGSTALQIGENESNSFESVGKYSTLTLRRFSPNVPNWPKMSSANPLKKGPDSYGFGYDYSMDYEVKFANQVPVFGGRRGREILRWTETGVLSAADVDYFDNYNPITTEKEGNIIKTSKAIPGGNAQCGGAGQIYTYRTLDSRVKNDSVNTGEINGGSYSIFNDNHSPSKQFYEELMGYMNSASGTVNALVGSDSGSLLGHLTQIKNDIDSINSKFQNLIDFDINNISGDITQLAENRTNIFTERDSINLLDEIQKAQDAVLDLSGFVDMGDTIFDGVLDFIDEQYTLFNVNGWELIFLDSWKDNIYDTMVGILEKLQKLKEIVEAASIQYAKINYLGNKSISGIPTPVSMNVPHNLEEKITDINGLLQNQSGQDIGCETGYQELCESLSQLLINYNNYVDNINHEKDGINDIVTPIFDDDGEQIGTGIVNNIFAKLIGASFFSDVSSAINIISNIGIGVGLSILLPVPGVWLAPSLLNNEDDTPVQKMYKTIYSIPSTGNNQLTGFIPGMNSTTSDRPIDSPRYLTFKGIGGDKVTLIYPDIYKVEVFSGDSEGGMLTLKQPEEIADAIKSYLRSVIVKYNTYLAQQQLKKDRYYNSKKDAFDTLGELDPLAVPQITGERSYTLFSGDYLINRLENTIRDSYNAGLYFSGETLAQEDPILFIANMMYYQNITWPIWMASGTIQGDFDNQRANFDINEKVSYLMDNYLISGNNKGSFLTPTYRDKGYEVAYINSDGNDYLTYEVDVPSVIVDTQNKKNNFSAPTNTESDDTKLEEELINECNIPLDGGVLLFTLSGDSIETPWWDAVKCRWEKVKEKPIEFKMTFPFSRDTGLDFWDNLYEVFQLDEYKEIGLKYPEQLGLLNTDDINDWVISNISASNPEKADNLHEVLSYTIITADKANISADNPKLKIDISSTKSFGNIEFHVVGIGIDKFIMKDGDEVLSSNITVSDNGYDTGDISFDPYLGKFIDFEINEPIEGLNVLMFYMCLPGTQTLDNCVRKSLRVDVVPGDIKNVSIEADRNIVLEGASLPFRINGTDQFGNNVGELISQKFLASVSSGTLTLNGSTSTGIMFSNFNKANFKLNAVGGNLDGKIITIQVSGYISGQPGIRAQTGINVVKGKLDVYSGSTKLASGASIITGISVKLPDEDIYFSVNSLNITQANSGTIPKVQLRLVDMHGDTINIDGTVTVKTKNGKLSPGIISQKVVTKNINGRDITINQNKFNKTSSFELSGGYVTIYLLPSFSAGDDLLNISMPGVDDIHLPLHVEPANPSVVKLSADNNVLKTNSSTRASIKVFDNRNNLIKKNVSVNLESTDNYKLSLSNSGKIVVTGGSFDFNVYSHDRGGFGYVYANIDSGDHPGIVQSPDSLSITVQMTMLPENKLNVMYLNLFGSDRGNQRGYMSDHEKYSESLIKNSDKLLAVTTQLLDYENIKYFANIIDKKLHIRNIAGKDISFSVNSGFVFDIKNIGQIRVSKNTFRLEEANISEEAIDGYIHHLMSSGADRGKNVLFYIPEQTDSILSGNEIRNSAIYINGEKVFSLVDGTFDQRLSTKLIDETIAGYQVWTLYFDETFAGKFLFAVDSNEAINITLESHSSDYGISQTRVDGSSDKYGRGFYLLNSELSNSTFGYKSIQDSFDINLGIGFTADFKNITNFGGGMPVGEATLPFSSELLINIGDPLLKRIDENESAKIYDQSGNVTKDTEFDLGPGEVIYSEPGKDIFKAINIDFNNDGLEDIIVIFKDGTIKILKNYGGTNPFQNLGALTILADRISDVSVGDVDGNGYEDLLIRTAAGGLRVYLNNKGIFDVDGYPVCINVNVDGGEISEHPERIAGTRQIFLEDMDVDGAMDIVTNDDLGFIKIFYGGTGSDGNINYLSTNKYMCDENWYERIMSANNSQTVYQFGVMMYTGHILDQSLIRWQGISGTGIGDVDVNDLGINSDMIENTDGISMSNIIDLLSNIMNFDVSAAESIYQQDTRLKQAGFDVIPVYESGIENSADIEYVEIGCLTGEDPVKIYKTYENLKNNPIDTNNVDISSPLVNGDLVRVSVVVEANENFSGTFIDNILGPWSIPLSEYNEDTFESFWFDESYVISGYITSGQVSDMAENMHWDLDNARYMIDNIHMRAGNKFKFSYGLIYTNSTVMDIDVDKIPGSRFSDYLVSGTMAGYTNNDKYPDISVQPQDGCNDSMFIFFNKGLQPHSNSRLYEQKYIDLSRLTNEYNTQAQQAQQQAMNGVFNGMTASGNSNGIASGSTDDGGAINSIHDYVSELANIWEQMDWKGMLTSEGLNLGGGASAVLELTSEALGLNDLANELNKMAGSACKGNKIDLGFGGNSCKGLPVPFNQAFLGEGTYHLFGCYNLDFLNSTIGAGMPVMTFPGNRGRVYGVYIPAPGIFGFPFKGQGDDFFLGLDGGDYPSLFRLYLIPTLTMKLGIAMCFGPYNLAGVDLSDPLGDIAGNCVVFAIDLPCGDSSDESYGANSTTEIPEAYTVLNGCNKQNIPCYVGTNESSTPFVLGGADYEHDNAFMKVVPEGSYAGGFINIEVTPQTSAPYQEPSPLDTETITLKGGATVQNKIRGSKDQGLIDIIVKKWLDKQIKYIMNSLTNFKVSLILPDFEGMIGNAGEISAESFSGFTDQYKETEKEKCENRGRQRDDTSKTCNKKTTQNFKDESLASIDEWSQNNLLSREEISSRSNYTNPFDELAKVFDETPLVNISTQDITVNVPLLSSEDITAYISMSQSWINRQTEILKEWEEFFTGIIGVCGGNTNINGTADLEAAVKELEEQYKDASEYSDGDEGDQEILNNLQGRINDLKTLRQKYNLNDLGEYKVYEEASGGYYVYTKYSYAASSIAPQDVYLYYDPATTNLSMFTSGFDLITENDGDSTKISIARNSDDISNKGLKIMKDTENVMHSCAALFNGGTMNNALKGFLNLHATAEAIIVRVKQNIETLQQYKKFPLELYERIHVVDRYLGDISSLLNSTLGTLSLWMETNANRFSQYVDAIISITTTLETYQMIIDFSKDWTESCSTCSNDNYDQFSCKLGGICDMLGIELPVISIPSMKIPSLYLDFSEIHIESDIKLPNLTFNPVAVPLPELPNLPSPPDIDLSMGIDEALAMGVDLIGQLLGIDFSSLSLNVGKVIPLLPSPPKLPELPSFLPTIEMELPLLPPAPKIPALPNKITSTIKAAKAIGKILCIIKGKIGLVMEQSVKAKVEQITQRTYEVPYWDNLDKTLSDLNTKTTASMGSFWGSIFTGFTALLQTNEFRDVNMKGFDLSLQAYVNLQFNLDIFYDFLKAVVDETNKVTYNITKYENIANDYMSTQSQRFSKRLQACAQTPLSVECLGEDFEEPLQQYNEWLDGIKESKQQLQLSAEELDMLDREIQQKNGTIKKLNKEIEDLEDELSDIENPTQAEIDYYQEKITITQQQILELNAQIEALNERYAAVSQSFNELVGEYGELVENFQNLRNRLLQKSQEVVQQIQDEIDQAGESMNWEDMEEFENRIKTESESTEIQKSKDKDTRFNNLQNLYKEPAGDVSYVDYNKDVNENNFKILKEMLTEINTETHNKDLKNKSQEYLDLIAMDRSVSANTESLDQVEKQYSTILESYQSNNDEVLNLIENDYDKFLAAVSDNDKSLVSDKSIDITLSAKLFNMDKNAISEISNHDNIAKTYMDYNMRNVDGYLNALNNSSAEKLNMSEDVYDMNKKYLSNIKQLANQAYDIIDNGGLNTSKKGTTKANTDIVLLAQNAGDGRPGNGGNNGGGGSQGNVGNTRSSSSIDIANYIQGSSLNTSEGSFMLANEDYIKNFQSKFVLTDINKDGKSDLILWDQHNVYIKYRAGNTNYTGAVYNDRVYTYEIKSYEELFNDADDNGIVKMKSSRSNVLRVKLVDKNWEVKNFKHVGQTFDSIKVSRSNSSMLGDEVDGYLVKMIHRVDQFNDHENLINQGNNSELFDKKYVLVLPKGAPVTGTKLEIEERVLNNTETRIGTGDIIFSLVTFNPGSEKINLTVSDLPRHWQYSEIYTLNFENNTYKITSSSSNQIVAGPQIIADTEGPDVEISLYRPATNSIVSEGTNLKGYVGTHYILQADWEDNVALDELWIADDMGNTIGERQNNISSRTGYIELTGLYFTGSQSLAYYLGGVDIDGNKYVEEIQLTINVPSIEIKDIVRGGQGLNYINGSIIYNTLQGGNIPTVGNNESFVSILTELDQDIDSGNIQFFRNRINNKRELMTGRINNYNITDFEVSPEITEYYGGYFDIGDDIGLYSMSGDMVAKINPNNGKITIIPGFENTVSIKLDYSPKIPVIKVMQGTKVLFRVIYSSETLVELGTSSGISVENLDNELFGEFNGGKALLKNNEVLLYISPKGQIYTDRGLYGEYGFDDSTQSVVYTFKENPNGANLGSVKVKIKNLLEY